MPTQLARSWLQKDHGQPGARDPRWSTDRAALYEHVHIRRGRAWVKWKQISTWGKFSLPQVGLIVKPLDIYDNVEAFILVEFPDAIAAVHETLQAQRLADDSVSARTGPAADGGSELAHVPETGADGLGTVHGG